MLFFFVPLRGCEDGPFSCHQDRSCQCSTTEAGAPGCCGGGQLIYTATLRCFLLFYQSRTTASSLLPLCLTYMAPKHQLCSIDLIPTPQSWGSCLHCMALRLGLILGLQILVLQLLQLQAVLVHSPMVLGHSSPSFPAPVCRSLAEAVFY